VEEEINIKKVIRNLIIDFHEAALKQPSLRTLEFPAIPKGVRKAYVLIGMRRSGKTWGLYQEMNRLLQKGIQKNQLLYINFEDERLIDFKVKDFQALLDVYFELYPEYVNLHDLYFFFDEIQEIEGWEKFIRRLLDSEQMQIYLSGSSAKMLSREIATSLRGRTVTREVFPYSFEEYLLRKQHSFPKHLSTKQQAVMRAHAQDYILRGGFPETIDMDLGRQRETLQDYIEVVIYRDVVQRHKVTNVAVLQRLLIFCLQNSASYLSVNKMYQSLKSLGFAIGKDSLYNFMGYFEDAYALFSLSLYTLSKRQEDIHPKKIYPVDPGVITAFTLGQQMTLASRLETTAFLHLRRKCETIFYFRTSAGTEVDFITVELGVPQALYQVSATLQQISTREREIGALQMAMHELEMKRGWIITLEEEEKIIVPEGIIHVVPLWKWLLDFAIE
jgi:hypothetical protein